MTIFNRVMPSWKPAERIKVSEWADKNRTLSSESSAEPGRWKSERTPYMISVMDAWAYSAGEEGDPAKLAERRTDTFFNRKIVMVSTPTVKGRSRIEAAYLQGTQEEWCIACPDCGEYSFIRFDDIRFEFESYDVAKQTHYKVKWVEWLCKRCGVLQSETDTKRQPGKMIARNPGALEKGVRSFWMNAWVSPWRTWESIVEDFLEARKDPLKLQVVYNTLFGELWENRGDIEDEETIMARREDYPKDADLPDGVLVLTAGVDTQDDRFEYEIVGHGHFGETWGVESGVIMGRPDNPETWAQLDDVVFNRTLRFASGTGLRVSVSFVDEGGHFTHEVRQQCRTRIRRNVFAIAGSNNFNAPYTAPPRKQKIVVEKTVIGTCWRYDIGVSAGKQIIMDNLRVQEPGPQYCHFPLRDDYGHGYFTKLLSECLVYRAARKHPWVWEKLPGRERNEALDCRNYALAAFKALPVNLDAVERKIKGQSAESAPAALQQPQTAKQKPRKGGGSTIDRFYDDW